MSQRYTLTVQGEEMINIGINPGDDVIFQAQTDANDGDIVCALINGDEAVLRRIYYFPSIGKIELRAENSTMKTTLHNQRNVQVQGKLVGIFRQY